MCSEVTRWNSLYSKCSCSRTPNSKTSGVQGEAGIQPQAWGHETACAPSKRSQVHGNIPAPANLLFPLPRVYLVSIFLWNMGFSLLTGTCGLSKINLWKGCKEGHFVACSAILCAEVLPCNCFRVLAVYLHFSTGAFHHWLWHWFDFLLQLVRPAVMLNIFKYVCA